MLCITNAKVVLETGILFNGRILIDGDKIVAADKAEVLTIPEGAEVIDAQGAYVGPGFVDIHNHGGGGYMFQDDPEKAAAYFLSHGETTQLATLYYDLSKDKFLAAIDRIKEAMGKGAGKAIGGFYMEGPYMNPKFGASPELNKWKGEIKTEDYEALVNRAGEHARVWAIAPEREGVEPFMAYAKAKNPSVVFSLGHCEANYAQIQRLKKYGIRIMTHCMNATGASTEWSGTKGYGPDEACMYDNDMYAEMICDSLGIHVNPALQRLLIKIKGVDRMLLISDSFVTDNTPPAHLKHITDLSFDGNGNLCGSRLTLDVVCRNLMTHTQCGITQAFLMAATNPAKAVGLENVGSIEVGKKANFVFVDDSFNVKKVMLEGKMI